MPAVHEGQVVQQEALSLQQIGLQLVIWAPSEWLDICRVRCAQQRGHGLRDAVTDTIGHLANHLAGGHM